MLQSSLLSSNYTKAPMHRDTIKITLFPSACSSFSILSFVIRRILQIALLLLVRQSRIRTSARSSWSYIPGASSVWSIAGAHWPPLWHSSLNSSWSHVRSSHHTCTVIPTWSIWWHTCLVVMLLLLLQCSGSLWWPVENLLVIVLNHS